MRLTAAELLTVYRYTPGQPEEADVPVRLDHLSRPDDGILVPLPSPEPLPRGVWRLSDPLHPVERVVVETWTATGLCLAAASVDVLHAPAVIATMEQLLDRVDPKARHLRIV